MKPLNNKRNYLLSLVSSLVSQFSISLLGLITVPIVLRYLGAEKYGIWAVITSITVYLSISGLGLTSSANTLLAKNNNIGDKLLIVKRVFLLLVISVSLFFLLFLGFNNYTDKWINFVGNVPDSLKTDIHQALFWMVVLF